MPTNNSILGIIGVCSILANEAYNTSSSAKDLPATKLLNKVSVGYTSYSIFQSHGFLVIAIAGTDQKGDWGFNLDREFVNLNGIRVHSGFMNFADIIAKSIPEDMRKPNVPLLITGHSLGGAAATLLPLLLPSLSPHAVVTFGAPKCLHAEDAIKYPRPVFNIRNVDDVVPWVPVTLPGRTWGVPGEVYYLTGTAVSVYPGSVLRRFGKQALSLTSYITHRGSGRLLGIREHGMDRYCKNIAKL